MFKRGIHLTQKKQLPPHELEGGEIMKTQFAQNFVMCGGFFEIPVQMIESRHQQNGLDPAGFQLE
jgi:hypothetical protein